MEHAFLPQNILQLGPEEIVYDLDGNEEAGKSGPLEYNWDEEEVVQETEPESSSAKEKPKKTKIRFNGDYVIEEDESDQYYEDGQFEEGFEEPGPYVEENVEEFEFSELDFAAGRKKATVMRCDICGKVVKSPSKIKAHMRTHTGEKPFQCSLCGTRFSQRTPFNNHMKKHMGDLPFECLDCGRRFVNNAQMRAHELWHQGLKRSGPPRPHLKPPKRRVYPLTAPLSPPRPPPKKDTFVADNGEIFEPLQIVQPIPHMLEAASSRIDDVIETVAAGTTKQKRRHACSRSTLLAQCNICGLMLKHASKIQEHLRTHTGEKAFTCAICGGGFARKQSLDLHMKRKHDKDARNIQCRWNCGMKFVSMSARNMHERAVHTQIRRYECHVPTCGRMFSRRFYLMQHRAKCHSTDHMPVFDPHEVTAAEEIEQHMETEEDGPDYDGEFLLQLPDGQFVLPDGTHLFEGEFVDEEEQDDAALRDPTTAGPSRIVKIERIEKISQVVKVEYSDREDDDDGPPVLEQIVGYENVESEPGDRKPLVLSSRDLF